MMTPAMLERIAPASAYYVPQLLLQMQRAKIDQTPQRAAMFLAQCHVESGGFRTVTESLNYSAERLLTLFGRHRISAEDCQRYGRTEDHKADERAIANVLYGGEWGKRNLGNLEPDDGWRFRGRGLKQLTGRDNYRRFSHWWQDNEVLLAQPELVAMPHGAVASAVWFWTDRALNELADTGDVIRVTKIVNGGRHGLEERHRWYDRYLSAFLTA